MLSRSIFLILILPAIAACATTNDCSTTDIQMVHARAAQGEAGAPMLLVPEGAFTMGSNTGQADEKPERQVTLSSFYIDKFEVSTAQYAKYMETTGAKAPVFWPTPVLVSHGQKPVAGVSGDEASNYCLYYGKRLPTEQEWEKAARGTDGRKYPWGNEEPTRRHANFGGGDIFNSYDTLVNFGSLEAGKSPFGIYDMAGNVEEWTSSDYDSSRKVVRGGSWGGELCNGASRQPINWWRRPGRGYLRLSEVSWNWASGVPRTVRNSPVS